MYFEQKMEMACKNRGTGIDSNQRRKKESAGQSCSNTGSYIRMIWNDGWKIDWLNVSFGTFLIPVYAKNPKL
jgi:hypothetical protein